MATNPFCIPCEKCDHWIEIDIRDENNQSFKQVKGTLTDAIGQSHVVRLNGKLLRIETLAAGPVTLTLKTEPWLKAVKARKPRPDNQPSSMAADAKKDQGVYRLITVGDLWQSPPETSLNQRHMPSNTPLRLITNKSYKLEVKAFRYLTLRMGIFFDGTNNNTASANWGLSQWEDYLAFWTSKCRGVNPDNIKQVAKSLAQSCRQAAPDSLEGSAVNEWTNVQKLFAVYPPEQHIKSEQKLIFRTYITGSGTENTSDSSKPAESSSSGLAFGEGDWGIEGKATTGIKSVTSRFLAALKKTEIEKYDYDGIQAIELDTFGFSRGSATVRHFINLCFLTTNNPFITSLTPAFSEKKLPLCDSFDWQNKRHFVVKFVGIFDTVAAVGGDWSLDVNDNKNGNVKLWLDPKRVEKVIHLTACPETEFRHNFSLNKINPAPNFEEYVLPGAHSDLGGGYYSRQMFAGYKQVGLPPLQEKKVIDVQLSYEYLSKREVSNISVIDESAAYTHIMSKRQNLIDQGWGKEDNFIIDPPSVFIEHPHYKGGKSVVTIQYKLKINRTVEGDLSRLYLSGDVWFGGVLSGAFSGYC